MSRLIVNQIQGDAVSKQIEIPSGHKLTGSSGAIAVPGSIIQVQHTLVDSVSSASFSANVLLDIPSLSVNITPKFSNSKMYITVRWCGEFGQNGSWNTMFNIKRNTSAIGPTSFPSGYSANQLGIHPPMTSYGGALDNSSTMEACNYDWYDTPGTTDEITYQATARFNGSGTLYTNRTVSADEYGTSSITVWEIAQ